jgi:hypothetical protein
MVQDKEPEITEYRNGPYLISTDPAMLDVERVHRFLSSWPGWEIDGIPRSLLERAISSSLCFGPATGRPAATQRRARRGGPPPSH